MILFGTLLSHRSFRRRELTAILRFGLFLVFPFAVQFVAQGESAAFRQQTIVGLH